MTDIIDLRRNPDARLQVARIAADLFWERGITATRGEDIATAAGIATRTLWRYFRTKEACVEPVLSTAARRFVGVLASWPRERRLEDHLSAQNLGGSPAHLDDDLRALRLIDLATRESAIRATWLLVCDECETVFAHAFAERLGATITDLDIRELAASVGGALRVVNEEISVAALGGRRFTSQELLDMLAAAVRTASNGRLGDAR